MAGGNKADIDGVSLVRCLDTIDAGTINASTCPDFMTGMGMVESVSDGSLFILK